jgi:hypothetical protein
MIQQFIDLLFTSLICIIWGLPLLLFGTIKEYQPGFWFHSYFGLLSFLFFAGCITLNLVTGWLILILPANFYLGLLMTMVLLVYLIVFKRRQVLQIFIHSNRTLAFGSFSEPLYLSISIILFILLSTLRPVNNDTQIYHLQIIKWLSEYGAVPGVANLFPRLGLGSGWFNLISILHISFFKTENYTFFNASFVCWFFLWLFDKYKYSRKQNNGVLALFYFSLSIYFMLDWQLFRDAANSTNYDFPVTAFMVIVTSFLIEKIIYKQPDEPFSYVLILFLLTIVSFKFSGIFALFLGAFYLLQKRKTRHLYGSAAMAVLILLPVFIKNYIITGYPFFPYPLSVHRPDWQLPVQLTEGLYRYILNSNRFYNSTFSADPMGSSPFYWAPFWFKGILIQHKVLFFLSIISTAALLVTKPISGINYTQLRGLVICLFVMLTGWFLTAPDPGRFGYGILLPISFLALSVTIYRLFRRSVYSIILYSTSIIFIYYAYSKAVFLINEPKYFISPVKGDRPQYSTKYINGVSIHVPEIINGNWNRRCFDISLPCTCQENPYLQVRGKNLKDGFKMFPQPDSSFVKSYIY